MNHNYRKAFNTFSDVTAQNRNLDRKNFETALLGKRAQFQCSVQSPNAAEVEIWWEFEGRNITQDEEHYEVLFHLHFINTPRSLVFRKFQEGEEHH